jgi:hypothetical protein
MEVNQLTFANRFSIVSQWKPREETPEELGRRTLSCLDMISPIHPAFRGWTFLDVSRDAMEMSEENIQEFLCPLEKARKRMTQIIVDWGVTMDDEGPEPAYGYNVSVSTTDIPDSQRVTFGAHGGGLVSWTGTPREASFHTDDSHEADPTIISYPVFKSVLLAIVSCWEVDYAVVYSHDLAKLWTEGHPFCDLSWMVYLSAPLARRITIPADVVVERVADGGPIMIAAEETFDVANPKHLAGAHSILNALAPLNAEESERIAESGW